MPGLSRIFESVSSKRSWGFGLAAVLLVAVAGFFAYRMLHHESLDEVASAINDAISTRDMERLNHYVDFQMLSLGIADAILQARSDGKWNEDERRVLSEAVQTTLAAAFNADAPALPERENRAEEADETAQLEAELPESDLPPEVKSAIAKALQRERAKKNLNKRDAVTKSIPLEPRPPFLPPDFIQQLMDRPFQVAGGDSALGILSTIISHPQAGYDVPLKLILRSGQQGWRVIGCGNARELVARHEQALQAWRTRVADAFRAENARRFDLMNQHYHVVSCQAFLAKNLGVQADVPLVVKLEGVNMGSQTLMSAGMTCHLRARNGTLLASVPLNTTRVLAPSDSFVQHWQMELPRDLPETRKLMAEPSLMCTTVLSAVSLGNGQIIHERTQSDLDKLLQ